jgi:hypothetical protein
MTVPFKLSRALCASSTARIVTKPKPRDRSLCSSAQSWESLELTNLLIVNNNSLFDFSVPSKLILQVPLVGPDTETKDSEDIVGWNWGVILSWTRRGVVVRPSLQKRL